MQTGTKPRIQPVEVKYEFDDGTVGPLRSQLMVVVTPDAVPGNGEVNLEDFSEIPIRSIPQLIELLKDIYAAFGEAEHRNSD